MKELSHGVCMTITSLLMILWFGFMVINLNRPRISPTFNELPKMMPETNGLPGQHLIRGTNNQLYWK